MPQAYEEILDGETHLRLAPSIPHELLCNRLHAWVRAALPADSPLHLPPRRTPIDLRPGWRVAPDLALIRPEDGRLQLAVEIIQPGDHNRDTVVKKLHYMDYKLSRLWIVDSRYHNVETYGMREEFFRLDTILANRNMLTDPHLPGFKRSMNELFAKPCP